MEYSQSEYRKMKVPGNKSSWAISLLAAKVPGSERVRERNRQWSQVNDVDRRRLWWAL